MFLPEWSFSYHTLFYRFLQPFIATENPGADNLSASVFGFVKDTFGWPAIFITIGCLYIIMLVLTLAARKMKMKKL